MRRRIKPFALALFLLLAATLPLALAFLPQPALAATPITNCTELQNIRNNLGGDYYLGNDIDCSCTSGWNGGAGFEPIGTFTGTFDGKGYKITNLYINRINHVGLFGYTGSGSEIKGVGLEEVSIRGNDYVGGFVGTNRGTIKYSYSSGSVNGSVNVGGFVGVNEYGSSTNCYWDTQTSGQSTSDGGTGKTTAQMKPQTTFSGWDFDNIGEIEEGVTYPFLQWQVDTTPPVITIDVPTETNSVYRKGREQFFLREFLLH